VRLTHAIKVVERLIGNKRLTAEEHVAVLVLVTMAKRVLDTRPSLRAVVRAVYGEDLNQAELDGLFKDPQE
jgi:hypothetical protein